MMDVTDSPILLPLLMKTSGDDIDSQQDQSSSSPNSSFDESMRNDPNKFNAYLNRGSELWAHWTWLGGQGKMSLMRCNYCLVNKQLKNAPKCRRHLIKCLKTPEMVRKYFEKKEVEASRVSAFMREIRSREVKFTRSEVREKQESAEEQKVPLPTANDLKHLQQKQQQASINNVIVKHNGSSNGTNSTKPSSISKKGNDRTDLINKTASLMNYSPLINRSSKSENNGSHNQSQDSLFSELNTFYQQIMSIAPSLPNDNTSPSNNKNGHNYHHNGNKSISNMSNKLKRKFSSSVDIIVQPPNNGNGNGNGNNYHHHHHHNNSQSVINNTNKENRKDHHHHQSQQQQQLQSNPSLKGVGNNTVIINLDDVNLMENNLFFDSIDNDHSAPMLMPNGGSRKKKRDSVITNGYSNGRSDTKNGDDSRNNHGNSGYLSDYDSKELEIANDDLNDLLASALISTGVDFDFVENPYFQKFVSKIVNLSSGTTNYRLPLPDKLATSNLSNLVRKYDYETAKIFSECDSIIVSFDSNKENVGNANIDRRLNLKIGQLKENNSQINGKGKKFGDLDVNLLISSSNTCSQLFFKTISSINKNSFEQNFKSSVDENLKSLNNQIDSLINKIGSDRINAVILPYSDNKSSELIYSYLLACHNHIVPLTNSYQLFHHLLCDICKIPSIYNLLFQCITFFQELAFNFIDFQEENQNLWKRVFESDKLKIYKHFLNKDSDSLPTKNNYWISLNLMLCWFLVAKSSIVDLFEKLASNDDSKTTTILEKINLKLDQIDTFFDQISVLFNFLTPFINAIHLIENESSVISDIIKIYYDVKLAINNKNFFDGINTFCDKIERQSIDYTLNNYLQEHNFSRYFFLAYYLDPRFRDDKRIEENEDLIAQVYDALFCYANALGCVSNEEEDREKLADSLDEFRNGDKLYGMQLLKCPKSPIKFWKHLRRFPGSAKLAYCAFRLLSISTRSMLLAAPIDDKCTSSIYHKILATKDNEIDMKTIEKILPIKSYLLSRCQKFPSVEESDERTLDSSNNDDHSILSKNCSSNENISNIISNVITSLEQYSCIIAQPFSHNDLSCLLQNSNNN